MLCAHRLVLSTALCALLFGGHALGEGSVPSAAAASTSAGIAECPDAAIREIHLPSRVEVDQITVEVDPGEGMQGGVTRVAVQAGAADRVLHARPMGAQSVKFSPALSSSTFQVVLDPIFDAPRGACVKRIALLSGGEVVAEVRP